MKRIGICGGAKVDYQLDTSLSYIGVDHGIDTLLKQGIQPMIGVGDFDSLQNKSVLKNLEIEILPTRKDITDTHYALLYALEHGYEEILIFGVTGGRVDHFMAILSLIQQFPNTHIFLLDSQNKIQILPAGTHYVKESEYTYFSVFALTHSYITLSSCEYPLDNYYLKKEDPLCVSNQISGEHVKIVTSDSILLIQSKDES